jgi:hypothetical protein
VRFLPGLERRLLLAYRRNDQRESPVRDDIGGCNISALNMGTMGCYN